MGFANAGAVRAAVVASMRALDRLEGDDLERALATLSTYYRRELGDVVDRDVKPDNLLYTSPEQPRRGPPLTPAERARRCREARAAREAASRAVTADVTETVTNVTPTVTEIVTASRDERDAAVTRASDQISPKFSKSETKGENQTREAVTNPVTESVTPTVTARDERRDVTPDPFGDGMLGAAWAEGVRQGSGATVAVPRGGALRALCDVVRAVPDVEPTLTGRAAWLRERGRAFGSALKGGTLNPFKFSDWVSAGFQVPAKVGRKRVEQLNPPKEEAPWLREPDDEETGT